MIEPEMAFYDIEDDMELAEDFVKNLVKYALDNCMDDLKFLNDKYDNGLIERMQGVVDTQFQRVTYTEGYQDIGRIRSQIRISSSLGYRHSERAREISCREIFQEAGHPYGLP
jgi:aspartyl/asparaginyl-tRNA synthetase